jgi:poly(hydroxyalkanoate) depolymerase family esterase
VFGFETKELSVKKKLSLRVCLLVALLAAFFAAPVAASSFTSKTSSGGRAYWLFVPTSYSAGNAAPLVVMLHGCTQNGDGFATSTGMNVVAEEKGFLVAYPVQPSSANASSCWNWFLPAHQARGAGEPASLAGVVTHVKSQYTIDNAKVYLAGFSAGGGMASIMGATYPDVFAAIGVHSGLEFKAATTQNAAFTAMSSGGPDPTTQGNAAYTAMGSFAQEVRVMVFHGTSDFTVATVNGNQTLTQWAQTNDRASDGADNNNIDDVADITQGGQVPGSSGRTYTRTAYQDTAGNIVLEKYLVDSMGHNWSGGPLGGTFTDPNGPSASRLMADFFLGTTGGGGPGDTTPPITTATPAGGTYTAAVNVTLSVNESANTFYTTNGSTPTQSSPLYASPIPIGANTTLRYFSVDLAGNAEALKQQIYVIDAGGGGGSSATLTSIDGEDGFAGALAADGVSTTVHKVGDKGMFNGDTFRLLLSFNTASVPAAATITGATLTIYRQSLSGTVTSLTVDAADLFGAAALAQSDYGAAADVASAAILAVPSSNGGSSSVNLPSSTYNLIKTGKLQLRIKATAAIDFTSDVLTVYGGGAGAQAPKLVVTWQ